MESSREILCVTCKHINTTYNNNPCATCLISSERLLYEPVPAKIESKILCDYCGVDGNLYHCLIPPKRRVLCGDCFGKIYDSEH